MSATLTTTKLPNYRILADGELIQPGDEYRDPYDGNWYPSHCIGREVGIPRCTSQKYRRLDTAGGAA